MHLHFSILLPKGDFLALLFASLYTSFLKRSLLLKERICSLPWSKIFFFKGSPDFCRPGKQKGDQKSCCLLLKKIAGTKPGGILFRTLLHSECPKLHRVLAILSGIGLNVVCLKFGCMDLV